ncbi:tetratricopeptide repeat protein [Rhodovarius crocodyli]|uniref:Tetratricopeptide repeat protein 38 n=1 Tax=Rhodovarius crocodyli TaxID=1979269 RepID=A0A437MHF3_9PROT|nr:tetratricopeptide repeat protein [Rhodovarius crocodyli]RVT97035.1 tetratricopeptide repeat protein [Rhodovarius crocodyli]
MTHRNAQGLEMSIASAEAAAAFDHLVEGFLKNRLDTPLRLKAVLALDAEAPLPALMKGVFAMLSYKSAAVPAALAAADKAEALNPNPREKMYIAAVRAWAGLDWDRALGIWEQLLVRHPRDILAFRLHHFTAFWLGRAPVMREMVERLMPAWDRDDPGYGSMLACRAFSAEECGDYAMAEYAGRAAVALDPADLWAIHAVAHTLEMQGRRGEGVAWIEGLRPHFGGTNNIRHHVLWHQAMYHMELGEHAKVLDLYDTGFRDLGSEVTQMQPDLYIDCQNAASMLWRLQRQGVDVGDRWIEIADKAEARIGDTLSGFTLPHWMMALTATGRDDAAGRMLDALREAARGNGPQAAILRDAALPVCEAISLHARGDAAAAVKRMLPALGTMHVLGGSHAQQDVLEQFFLVAARDADDQAAMRTLLERVASRHPVPPARRAGYRDAAAAVAY